LVAAVAIWPSDGIAQKAKATFAPGGTTGTLRVTINVVGSGREEPMAGLYDSLSWQVRHTVSYEASLEALPPIPDTTAGNAAAMADAQAAGEAAAGEVFDDKAQALQDKWDQKLDACKEDEACEMRVMPAMMADPEYRRLVLKVQQKAGGVIAKAAAIDLSPRFQTWTPRMGPDPRAPWIKGTARLERRERRFGIPSEIGGRKYNETNGWSGSGALALDRSVRGGNRGLVVDGETGSFSVVIPADFQLPVELCRGEGAACNATGEKRPVRLLEGQPADGKGFFPELTATGKVATPGSPKASGTLSFSPKLTREGAVKVTIEWSFAPSGAAR
jgi:hypothetical protein